MHAQQSAPSGLPPVQFSPLRAPATPLVTHDPYFSVWSNTDRLTDSDTSHWTGRPNRLSGLVRIDGKAFRVMGRDPDDLPALPQTSVTLTATHTRYRFAGAGIVLDLAFFTPAFLDDPDILSRPVTYLTWTAASSDGAAHDVSVFLGASPDLATSYPSQPVTTTRNHTASLQVLSVGTRDQRILNRTGDDLRIDWGYFHLAVPNDEPGSGLAIATGQSHTFAETGALTAADALPTADFPQHDEPSLAATIPLGKVGASPVSRHLLLSYTDDYSIQFLQQNLRPWWQRNGKSAAAMLDEAARDYAALDARGTQFDRDLNDDLTRSAGEHYAALCTLAYRQSIAARKLVAGPHGEPLYFAKENFSNGSIATVDVMYPAAPILLFFNPRLLEAEVLPILEYSTFTNRWRFPFAPHDIGQYPIANGQLYGGGERTEQDQMPVEESGNVLLLVDAVTRATTGADGRPDTHLAERFWPQLSQWAVFLRDHGLDPERQLTTDDFAGHVVHNANLALKAIDALEAYADLAKLTHHDAEARQYTATAHDYAKKWIEMDREGDHFKLAYNSPGTWSQKYNLVWDKVLDYNLFPKSVRESEIAFYRTKLNTYGLPLDNRATYTKNDWTIWTATLADTPEGFNALVDPIYKWANESSSRVPMTDWYDSITGKQEGFQARSVVGGFFIKALADKPLAQKWRSKAAAR